MSDAPNEHESKRGLPMLGNAGDEFDLWLRRTCRLTRDDVWITVLQREFTKKDREATAEEIEEFWTEVNAIGPRIIVPLGNESLRLVLGPWASMELCAGLPHRCDYPTINYGIWSGVVLPIPHPGGINYIGMVDGFTALGDCLNERRPVYQVDTAPVSYREWRDTDVRGFHCDEILAIDTEGSTEHPWCLTFSCDERRAGLVRADQRWALDCFAAAIDQQRPTIVMHYAPHDLRVLDALGVHIDTSRIKVLDTMQLAYIAGKMPQGLKTLAYRLCGMRMRDYMDLVGPHEERIAAEYLDITEALFAPAHPKDKKHPVYKAIQRCKKSKRGARALWLDQQPAILDMAAAFHGSRMPSATLDDVPFSEVLPYACADADGTRRVFLKLREYFD